MWNEATALAILVHVRIFHTFKKVDKPVGLIQITQVFIICQLIAHIQDTSLNTRHYLVDDEVKQNWRNETPLSNSTDRFE